MSKEKSISKLKEDLAEFKENAVKKGWEEEEVDEKVAEVFENFPWYKFNGEVKMTWKAKVWNLCLWCLIIYLGVGAVLQRNKRMRKNINDYMFDLQLPYHNNRIWRYFTLPIFKFYDLSQHSDSECLINNPFVGKAVQKCDFCQNITSFQLGKSEGENRNETLWSGEIVKFDDVPGYSTAPYGFTHVKQLFAEHGAELDYHICRIYLTSGYSKVSDYFKLSEEQVNEKSISIGWRNCGGYGSRFYRKLFKRPAFIPKTSEIVLEKIMYFVQPGGNITLETESSGQNTYIYQVQGGGTYSFEAPQACHDDCIDSPIDVTLQAGQIVVYPNYGWIVTFRGSGERLSIVYMSHYDG